MKNEFKETKTYWGDKINSQLSIIEWLTLTGEVWAAGQVFLLHSGWYPRLLAGFATNIGWGILAQRPTIQAYKLYKSPSVKMQQTQPNFSNNDEAVKKLIVSIISRTCFTFRKNVK